MELNPADIQIFLESVDLEEVGSFKGPNVSSSLPDFPLEIADDFLEIRFIEAGVDELVPEPLSIKAQAHALAGQPAVGRVSLLDPLVRESTGRAVEGLGIRGCLHSRPAPAELARRAVGN
ncbi:MAG: hypothetical protein ACKV0T_00290 [Planctomycetales bacterium]